ncbi:MAG: L-serine ammonia-lyase, iron-sulfur-dependent, subunit alpha [Oscillospiraceae bacterium]|nr:L-serine ammonia-lyase, iron-sulfur-dependent, subunit alpha [Oscillospiraceae bacterium]
MQYNSIAQMLTLAETHNMSLWQVVLEAEMAQTEQSADDIFRRLSARYEVMRRSAKRALEEPLPTIGGLIEGVASTQHTYAATGGISGEFINRLMAQALSASEVNASMGKICAAPTAGACGVLPSVLMSVGEKYDADNQRILEALLIASGIGVVIMTNATVAGAEGGCQAECGAAAAMAAAGAVYLAGGSNQTTERAVAIALMNVLGLVCDPVAGLVQIPCAQRNASQAVNALISADMALAGMDSVVPADEMIDAMFQVGRMLPASLRETGKGGTAGTPAGKAIYRRVFRDR